ncbi:MAG: hypothetical protein JRI55_35765 [Deltaproteobacteria bacterium]|jgi:hypothetical protein|nr:hypothetical protein [Deltaproteobacteria bacterium]
MSARPTLECPAAPSDTGAYRLAWKGDSQGKLFRLEENGEVLYVGPQQATTVSGRAEGSYSYRVGMLEGKKVSSWSEPCTVVVSPPSLALALTLFGVGLFVFLATVFAVVRGHRAHRRGENLP